jgi:hypothetical protein
MEVKHGEDSPRQSPPSEKEEVEYERSSLQASSQHQDVKLRHSSATVSNKPEKVLLFNEGFGKC